MKRTGHSLTIFFAILIILMAASTSAAGGEVRASFLYTLSNFEGPVPYHWPNITVDKQKNEIYVLGGRERDIRIFNEKGMEIYRFGEDGELGNIVDLAVDGDGNILLLTKTRSKPAITLCNFRGEPVSKINIKNLPPEFSVFSPDRMVYREGRIYLADRGAMKIAMTEAKGNFEKGYDIASLIGLEEKERANTDMAGFSVDGEGNMLFTIPVLFSAYRLSPDGKLTGFGSPGSGPGRFGVVAGIASGDNGYIYVSDKLRCVVMVFDENLRFQTEFGYRGYRRGNLIVPNDLAVDGDGRVYVAQAGNRGISVFRMSYN